jgi:hypothetical protein
VRDPAGRVASIQDLLESMSGPSMADGRALPGGPTEMAFRLESRDGTIGDLDLGCETGYVVREYDLGFPQMKEVVQPIALDDGTIDLTRFIGQRAVNLDVVIDARNSQPGQPNTEAKMRSRLGAFMHPRLRPWLIFREEGDDRVRRMALRGSSAALAVSIPRFNRMGVSWVAPLGVIESYEQRDYNLIGIQGDQIDVTNDGDVPAHWACAMQGPIKNPRFQIGEEKLALEVEINAGQILGLNSRTKTVVIDGDSSNYQFFERGSTWFRIPPGPTTLQFTYDTTFGTPSLIQFRFQAGTWLI